jgi:biopolymer transport protein ExbD
MSRQSLFNEETDESPLLKRRSLPSGELDITPMIDVTFLLLIFFMVSSTMQTEAQVDVPKARHGINTDTRGTGTYSVEVRVDNASSPPRAYAVVDGGRRLELSQLSATVAARARRNERKVIVRADRRAPHGAVNEAVRAILETEGVEFFIAVNDEPEQ